MAKSNPTEPVIRLLGHAINQIRNHMEVGTTSFRVSIVTELANDDCFQTVLNGYLEGSSYTLRETILDRHTAELAFERH